MTDVSIGYAQGPGGYYSLADRSGPYSIDLNGNLTLLSNAKVIGADGTVAGGSAWVEADNYLTRPANATPTVVHGSIGGTSSLGGTTCLFTFSNFFDANAQNSFLTGMKMVIGLAGIAIPASIAIRMHLYQDDETAVELSSNADAATYKSMVAAAAKKFGFVDFTTWNIGGTGSDSISSYGVPCFNSNIVPIKAAAASRGFFAIGEATAIFTPINAGVQHLYASRAS